MTAPALVAETSGGVTASGTSHAVTLPATVNAGDRLVAVASVRNSDAGSSTFTWGAGWTELIDTYDDSNHSISVAWKIADGTEDGGTVTVTSSVTEKCIHKSWGFSGAGNVYAGAEAYAYGTGPNPPSLDPGLGSKDYHWIALAGQEGNQNVSGYPAGYTNTGYYNPNVAWGDDATLAWGRKTSTASSEDPAAFTMSGSATGLGITIGIVAAVPTIVSVTPSDPYPGELVSIVTSGYSSAPLTANCAYNGVGLTLEAGATTTLCTAYWPALSTFLFGAAHAATAWDTNYTLTIANASDSDTHTVQTTAPNPGDFGVRNSSTAGYTLDTYNTDKVLATSDLVYGRTTVGTATINAPYVDFQPFEAAVTVLWRFWDVSQSSWSSETTTTYAEGFTLTSSDTTVTPGQTVTVTLAGGPFAAAITAAYAIYGVHEIPVAWTVIDAEETDVTMPALSQFSQGLLAEYLPWYSNFVIRIEAGEESAESPITNQVVAPVAGDYGTVTAPPWGHPPSGAQEGDKAFVEIVSGAGTATPETFDFTESETSVVYFYTFNEATQRWLIRGSLDDVGVVGSILRSVLKSILTSVVK